MKWRSLALLMICLLATAALIIGGSARAQESVRYGAVGSCAASGNDAARMVETWLNDQTKKGWQFVSASMGASGMLPCVLVIFKRP